MTADNPRFGLELARLALRRELNQNYRPSSGHIFAKSVENIEPASVPEGVETGASPDKLIGLRVRNQAGQEGKIIGRRPIDGNEYIVARMTGMTGEGTAMFPEHFLGTIYEIIE